MMKPVIPFLFFILAVIPCKADTIDFWQLRVNSEIVLEGFCNTRDRSELPTFTIDSSQFSAAKSIGIFYGGCFIPARMFIKIVNENDESLIVKADLTSRHGVFYIPENWWKLFPANQNLIVYLLPDRSADGVVSYFPAFNIRIE